MKTPDLRSTVRRCHLPVSLVAALGACLLVACGGGGGSSPILEQPAARPEVLNASQPGELLAFMKERIQKRWAAGMSSGSGGFVTVDLVVSTTSAGPAGNSAPTSFSSTTVQEAGVDEDDLMKTDGSLIYSLAPPLGATASSRLLVHKLQDNGRAQLSAELLLPAPDGFNSPFSLGLQLAGSGQRVAIVGQGWKGGWSDCPPGVACISDSLLPYFAAEVREQVALDVVSVSNPAAPRMESRILIDGSLLGTRRIGDALYVVSSWSPRLTLDTLPASAPAAERDAALGKLKTSDLMPTIRIDGAAAQPLLQDTDCWLQPANASLDLRLTVITRFDLAAGSLTRSSRCIAGGSEALYMSPTSLVLATTRYPVVTGADGLMRYPSTALTDVHKFALVASGVDYRGSASVPGHLGWNPEQKADRISDFNGDLRVLTFSGETGWFITALDTVVPPPGASPATLTVLRERSSDKTLQVIGQLPNAHRPQWIGHEGEQVYAVRFVGPRAYVVTFRRTDPLYVLDLAIPADPRIAGELKAPGFSDYLYPLANGLLFGVGRDATAEGRALGVKVGLFDVSDPANPKEVATRSFGEAFSSTGLNYSRHGINLFTQGSTTRIALPMFVRNAVPAQSQQGLQRFEVDTVAKSLLVKPMIGAVTTEYEDPYDPLWWQRSVQIGAQVHWLSRGTVTSWDW